MSFRDWLTAQADREDPVGDLGCDLSQDAAAPAGDRALLLYLYRRQPQAAKVAALEYRAARRRRPPTSVSIERERRACTK
jgi:hypothetical protein